EFQEGCTKRISRGAGQNALGLGDQFMSLSITAEPRLLFMEVNSKPITRQSSSARTPTLYNSRGCWTGGCVSAGLKRRRNMPSEPPCSTVENTTTISVVAKIQVRPSVRGSARASANES